MAIFSPSEEARPQTEWHAGGGAQHGRRITTRWTGVPTSRDISHPIWRGPDVSGLNEFVPPG